MSGAYEVKIENLPKCCWECERLDFYLGEYPSENLSYHCKSKIMIPVIKKSCERRKVEEEVTV